MQTALQNLTISTNPTQINQSHNLSPGTLGSLPTHTINSSAPVSSSAPTLAVAPASGHGDYPRTVQSNGKPVTFSSNALIVGGIVGVSILVGAVIVGRSLPKPVEPSPEPVKVETSLPDPTPVLEATPIPGTPEPPPVPAPPSDLLSAVESPVSSPSWTFIGTASSGESVFVDASSIRPSGDSVDFEYQIGDEQIAASADCSGNRWYAEQYGWYSPQSEATQSMLNFVCQ